jgi:hypothetical protein
LIRKWFSHHKGNVSWNLYFYFSQAFTNARAEVASLYSESTPAPGTSI